MIVVRRPCFCLSGLFIVGFTTLSAAESVEPTVRQLVATELAETNRIRHREASTMAEWRLERQRLASELDALNAERDRFISETAACEHQRHDAEAQTLALRDTQDPLVIAAHAVASAMRELAATTIPGGIVLPHSDEPAAVLDAFEASRRVGSMVTVSIIAGHPVGMPADQRLAVRMLRVGGAVAWYESLTGQQAGTVSMANGFPELTPIMDEHGQRAIQRAIAIAEGRSAADVVGLPGPWIPAISQTVRP